MFVLCYCISFHHFNVYVENIVFVRMLMSWFAFAKPKYRNYLLTYLQKQYIGK